MQKSHIKSRFYSLPFSSIERNVSSVDVLGAFCVHYWRPKHRFARFQKDTVIYRIVNRDQFPAHGLENHNVYRDLFEIVQMKRV